MNMGINNDTSDILYANSNTGSSNSNTRVNCEEEKVEGKKNCKKKSWSKLEVAVLVNSWKHLYKEIETFKQPSAWLKLKELVDKQGQPKFLIQIKSKWRNLKDSYKQSKDNNKKTVALPRYRFFYHDFDEVLGTRDVVNLQYVIQLGAKDAVPEPPKHSHGCPMVHTPSMQYLSNI